MPRYEITVTRTKVYAVRAPNKREAEDLVLLGEVEERESKEDVALMEGAPICLCVPWNTAARTICEERSPSGEWRCSREYRHEGEHVACSAHGPDDETGEHNLVTWLDDRVISGDYATSERAYLNGENEDEYDEEYERDHDDLDEEEE